MKTYEATEQAYKNGYEKGKQDAVKRGEWVFDNTKNKFVCTECGFESKYYYNYCPSCGTSMCAKVKSDEKT